MHEHHYLDAESLHVALDAQYQQAEMQKNKEIFEFAQLIREKDIKFLARPITKSLLIFISEPKFVHKGFCDKKFKPLNFVECFLIS